MSKHYGPASGKHSWFPAEMARRISAYLILPILLATGSGAIALQAKAQQEMAPGFSARAPRSPMTWSAKADSQFPNGVML
jgi:hypothetical protein